MLAENPAALFNNAQEKLRQKGLLGNQRTFKLKGFDSATAKSLIEQGEPSGALNSFGKLHFTEKILFRAQKRKFLDQLSLWDYPVPQGTLSNSTVDVRSPGPIKALYFANNSVPFTHSGYTLRTQKLLKAMRLNGLSLTVATRLGYPLVIGSFPTNKTQSVDGLEYLRLVPWFYPANENKRVRTTAKLVAREARKRDIDILHTTTDYKNGLVIAEAAEQLGVPWVYEVRGQLESTWLSRFPSELQGKYRKSEYYVRTSRKETEVMSVADAVIVLSEVSKRELVGRGIEEKKIFVAPNAIDPSEVVTSFDREKLRSELGISVKPEDVLFGSVSSVVDYEGLDTAVLSLHQLPDHFKLLIVGDGTARPNIEELARNENLADRVLFAGRQPNAEAWKWYGALNVFVVPRRDTQVCRVVTPIKTLMAQAMAIPIVSSDLPALREIASGAIFVPPENPGELARGVLAACDDASERNEQKSAPAPQTWESNATIIEHSYRYALFGTRPR
ncbi:glycosyltransferase family 4 protein [Corynebacterium casei]|uniref:glycosyltransferase family 4 protein n=1 Tax=Corynebacterium casei TaxID=160386 RepID=UPI003FCEEFCC